MTILFLCGCLEPGRDGVGDYVCRLALELLRQGHKVAGIALNDHFSSREALVTQPTDAGSLLLLRLPAGWSARRRFGRAQQWAAERNPDWVSLQFVSYAFQPKGLPLLLATHLRGLLQGRRLHLMLHESWVSGGPEASLKRQLLSGLQKTLVRGLLTRLRPAVTHTHLPFFRDQIQDLDLPVGPLPLFSNIPVVAVPPAPAPGVLRVGLFSQAEASAPLLDFLTELAAQAARHSVPFRVLLMGGDAGKMRVFGAALEQAASLRDKIGYTGFLAPAALSQALQTCTLGLTSVPRHTLGKSGSVAAFLAHGIPVAAPIAHRAHAAAGIGFFTARLRTAILTQPALERLGAAQAAAQAARHTNQVAAIAQTFLRDLSSAG